MSEGWRSLTSPVWIDGADGGKTLTFFNNDYRGHFQTVTFEGPHVKKLFHGSFHKVSAPPLCFASAIVSRFGSRGAPQSVATCIFRLQRQKGAARFSSSSED